MDTKKKKSLMKILIIIFSSFFIFLLLALAIPFSIYGIKSKVIDNDYQYVLKENKITSKKLDVPLIKQDISCGYAIIEMMSDYYGNKVTEKELYEKNNNGISTSTTNGFVKEINDTIKGKNYNSLSYAKNDELLLAINKSLLADKPVAVEWAAKLDGAWTLHWSVVTGMDDNKIYINNPYGYKEEISYEEFISRTTFKAFSNMPLGYNFGFAYGLFSKNTIIY